MAKSDLITAGDLCEVVSGALGEFSPNIGLIVTVHSFRGEHSVFGRIWRCETADAILHQPGTNPGLPTQADFAQSWLKKIDPPAQSTATTQTKELAL